MRCFKYRKVDAFTSGSSKGNPAAYIMLGSETLTAEQMLEIGKEHSGFVSEIVFCEMSDKADVKLIYYSSECEVDFCGHGTIATMFDIIKNDTVLIKKSVIDIETNRKGVLKVYNQLRDDGVIYIAAPKAQFLSRNITAQQIACALGISTMKLDGSFGIECIDAGLRTLIVPISDLNQEVSMFPDESSLKHFCEDNEIDIILPFCMKAASNRFIAHTRVFAPRFGYLEDPATGSGNSAFANYMLKNKLWDGSPAAVEQGGAGIAFNTVNLKTFENSVLFGGKATLKIAGEYYL